MTAGGCADCGAASRLEVDHIEPLWEGGPKEDSNLQALCRSCHILKHKRPLSAAERAWELHLKSFTG